MAVGQRYYNNKNPAGAINCPSRIFIGIYPFYLYRRILHMFFELPDCLKCLSKILDDIIDVLCTDRKTDGIRLNTLIQKLCLVAL